MRKKLVKYLMKWAEKHAFNVKSPQYEENDLITPIHKVVIDFDKCELRIDLD